METLKRHFSSKCYENKTFTEDVPLPGNVPATNPEQEHLAGRADRHATVVKQNNDLKSNKIFACFITRK